MAIARKDGMTALEGQEVPDNSFKGHAMLVDGADETKLPTNDPRNKSYEASP